MLQTSGTVVRRVVAASASVVLLGTLAACGESGEGGVDAPAAEPSARAESPTSETSDGGESSGADRPGSHADGECGDGDFETQVVQADLGVQITVPADWKTRVNGKNDQVAFYPPNRDVGDGFIVIEDKDQTLEEAMEDVEKFDSVAEMTSEQEVDLEGFEAGKLLTYEYDDGTFTVHVVAVDDDGLRVNVNMTRESPQEQPAVESCLSSLTRAG